MYYFDNDNTYMYVTAGNFCVYLYNGNFQVHVYKKKCGQQCCDHIHIFGIYLLHYDKPFAIIRIFTVHVCQWNSIMSINLIDDCIPLPPAVRFDQPNIFPFTIISL